MLLSEMEREASDQRNEIDVLESLRLAQDVISADSGDTDRVTLINHGHTSVVAVVDRQAVFKFSRSPYAAIRNEFELFVLRELDAMKTCDIPLGLRRGPEPSWTALSFLAGEHMSYSQLRAMPASAKKGLGVSIGRFTHELHSSLDTAMVDAKRRELRLDELDEAPWPIHFERTVRGGPFATEQQHGIAMQTYGEWSAQMRKPSTEVVIHDDLHADNLLFRDNALVGVLDFGEVTVGSPEQELRHTLWIGEDVARVAISTYEACSGTQINKELVRLWSVMQELAAFSEYSQKGQYDHPSYLRARSGLKHLLPEGDWESEPNE